MLRLAAISGSVALAAMLAALWYVGAGQTSDDPFAQCRSGAVAGGTGSIGGPFELVNAQGKTVTDADVITRPSLVYFGYTFCPDVCPFDTARNAEATDLLMDRGYDVQPVFISVDPERDTPDVVGDFADNMHERMVGLTGSPDQIKAASQAYRTYYQAQDGDPDYYLVDHSTFTYLVLPEAGFVEFFRREVPPREMADKVACFLDARPDAQ
jgi:protein SCO1/2